jgi:transcriptional regulator with XRE-family HTH domain
MNKRQVFRPERGYGAKIAQARLEKGLNQDALAGMIGVETRTISRWEKEVSFPQLALREQLSKVLSKSLQDLNLIPTLVDQDYGEVSPLPQPGKSRRVVRWLYVWISLVILLLLLAGVLYYRGVFSYFSGQSHTMTSPGLPDYCGSLQVAPIHASSALCKSPSLNDNLSQNDHGRWPDASFSQTAACTFASGGYEVSVAGNGYVLPCVSQMVKYTNFAFQVDMTFVQGDGGGLIFRSADIGSVASYRLRIGPDGNYDLCVTCGSSLTDIIGYGSSSAINRGEGKVNTLTAIVYNSTIYIYVNDQLIINVNNRIYNSGYIGLFAVDFTQATSVIFRNLKLWQIK